MSNLLYSTVFRVIQEIILQVGVLKQLQNIHVLSNRLLGRKLFFTLTKYL